MPLTTYTQNSGLEPFDFHGHEVRVLVSDGGEPRWVASDVAKILGYRDAEKMTRMLDRDEVYSEKVETGTPGTGISQVRRMNVITESGLYTAIFHSQRPEALDFRRWVTREVLPTIRKRGAYMTDQTIEQVLTDPDTIIKLATDLKHERERAAEHAARAQELEAPAKSWNHLAAPGGDYSVSAAAKVLSRAPGIEIGRKRLFDVMSEIGWIYRTKGKRTHWEAYQDRAIRTGRLVHKLSGNFFNEQTEEWEQAAPTIRITPKGLQELHTHLGGTAQIALDYQKGQP